MLSEYKDVLSVEEFCEILNICPTTAYKYLQKNIIPNRKIGKKIFIPKQGLIDFLMKI